MKYQLLQHELSGTLANTRTDASCYSSRLRSVTEYIARQVG